MTANRLPISVLIPAKNEAENLADCLASVAWAEQIVVIDSSSQDATQQIARSHGAEVFDFHWDGNFPKKKNWALANVPWRHAWVFIIDADERAPPGFAEELSALLENPGSNVGYYVNRRFWFLNGWLNHCGYYPSWNLRLFLHQSGRYEQFPDVVDTSSGDNEVHEHVLLDGGIGYLKGELDHYAFPTLAIWVEKHNRYSSWEARVELSRQAQNTSLTSALPTGLSIKRRLHHIARHLPFRPTQRFFYHYILRAGWLDGYRGYVFCKLMAFYEFLTLAKREEMRRPSKPSN